MIARIRRAAIDRSLNMRDAEALREEEFGESQKVVNAEVKCCRYRRGGEQASGVLCRWLGTVAQDRLADVFVMGVAGLDLLRDRVHVAKAAFELVGAEYGGGARHVIGGVDHRGGLVNRPGRGEAKRYPVLFAEIPGLRQIAPRLIGCRIEIGTRRTQIAFEAADC